MWGPASNMRRSPLLKAKASTTGMPKRVSVYIMAAAGTPSMRKTSQACVWFTTTLKYVSMTRARCAKLMRSHLHLGSWHDCMHTALLPDRPMRVYETCGAAKDATYGRRDTNASRESIGVQRFGAVSEWCGPHILTGQKEPNFAVK